MSLDGNEYRRMHLGSFEPDISYEYLLKRVKREACSRIAEELHLAHKRNEHYKTKIAELEKENERLTKNAEYTRWAGGKIPTSGGDL